MYGKDKGGERRRARVGGGGPGRVTREGVLPTPPSVHLNSPRPAVTGRVWLRFPSRPAGEGAAPWLAGRGSVQAGAAPGGRGQDSPPPFPSCRCRGSARTCLPEVPQQRGRSVLGPGAVPRDQGLPGKAGGGAGRAPRCAQAVDGAVSPLPNFILLALFLNGISLSRRDS